MNYVLRAMRSLPSLQGLCGVLFANQPTYSKGLFHANHQGADQELPDLMSVSPTRLPGHDKSHCLFSAHHSTVQPCRVPSTRQGLKQERNE